MTTPTQQQDKATLTLFSATLFLSAALMFSVQPMLGKMLLPLVGGTPSGWIVAMAFFQVMLLAGYYLAHHLSRFNPRRQARLYVICLVLGLFFLPVSLAKSAHLVGDRAGALDVFLLLTAVVAVPFIALSATASTLQRLFTATDHASAKDPYFLYAASNLGSFVGLLAYPFFIEPLWTLTTQSRLWLGGYIVLILLAVACLLSTTGNGQASSVKMPKTKSAATRKQKTEWFLLSFIPSGLLLAVTTHITTDVFSVPLLWVIPLGIYLLTFVVAFSKTSFVRYDWILKLQPPAVAIALVLALVVKGPVGASLYAIAMHLAAFGIVAFMCHMRLARVRPADNTEQLTEYYLMISVGGALGGVLNAFIAPVIFNRLIEYPLMLILTPFFNEGLRSKIRKPYFIAMAAGIPLAGFLAYIHGDAIAANPTHNLLIMTAFVLMTLHPRLLATLGALAFAGHCILYSAMDPPLLTHRNFYGVIRVFDKYTQLTPGVSTQMRHLQHGTTLHGMQIQNRELEVVPTTYYSHEGPLGDIFRFLQPRTVAAVGLGAGTINCYSSPERKITFFDIDPDVVRISKEYFTFLSKCGNGMPDHIILGDARLEIQKLDEKFDLIILDAFSSDTVPTHLLTKEAMEIYLEHLNPDGIILFHTSNRHFLLDGPITATAALLNLKNATIFRPHLPQFFATGSRWTALARQRVDLGPLGQTGWVHAFLTRDVRPWTDDYTNLMDTLNF